MVSNKNNANTGAESNRSSKKIVTVVGVIIALITAVTVFLFVKEPAFVAAASEAVLNSKLDTAEKYLFLCNDEEAEMLADYIDLRQAISAEYISMRSNFDRGRIEEWQRTAAKLRDNGYFTNDELNKQLNSLCEKLDNICTTLAEYEALKPETMALFDVFNEANRLYTKDSTGMNPVFTIEQEFAAIAEWEEIARKLEDFISGTTNGGKMYLLTFFVKEAQGEAADLRTSINNFVMQGYDVGAPIRVTGSLNRTFPSIRNSNGILVNLQQKETYESCMYQGMCVELIESLGEFIV